VPHTIKKIGESTFFGSVDIVYFKNFKYTPKKKLSHFAAGEKYFAV
jgi:hypothetical protein